MYSWLYIIYILVTLVALVNMLTDKVIK